MQSSKEQQGEIRKPSSEINAKKQRKRTEAKGKGEKERYTHLKAEFQRQQGEIRKSSSLINEKKQKKTMEWERLEISSRKLEKQRK